MAGKSAVLRLGFCLLLWVAWADSGAGLGGERGWGMVGLELYLSTKLI